MTLLEVLVILNLVILLFVVYTQAKFDAILEGMAQALSELWENQGSDK